MKIGITFFGSKLDLLCISKVLTIFCVFSKVRRKRKRSRGHVACSPSARGDFSVWALGRAAHSGSTREGFSRLGHAGHMAGSGASGETPGESVLGTRVLLGGLPDVFCGLGTRGQVASSATSEGILPAGYLGTRVILRKFPKEVPAKASKGPFGRASGRLRRGFGTRGTLRRAPKGGGASGWHVPKGSSKGFPRGSSKGSREGLPD